MYDQFRQHRIERARDTAARSEAAVEADPLACRVVRMNANATVNVAVLFRDRPHRIEFRELSADRDHRAHTGVLSARQHAVEILGEVRKIQMTMTVDQHQAALSASASVKRGNTPSGLGSAAPGASA